MFEFDLGGRLTTRPHEKLTQNLDAQWMLYGPSGSGLVFTFRADGTYSHEIADPPPEQVAWLPLLTKPAA